MQTLRGLVSPVAYVCLAPDGSMVAANTHDWQVGIWDVRTGMLRHVLAVPKGVTADNAAMAFSPDASRFAFSAGNQVTLWRIDSGENDPFVAAYRTGWWSCSPFPDSERLLSFRKETRSGEAKAVRRYAVPGRSTRLPHSRFAEREPYSPDCGDLGLPSAHLLRRLCVGRIAFRCGWTRWSETATSEY